MAEGGVKLLDPRFWKRHLRVVRLGLQDQLRRLTNVPQELGLQQGRYMDADVWAHCMKTMKYMREGGVSIGGFQVHMRYASVSKVRCVHEGAFYLWLCERFVSALALAHPLQKSLRVTLVDCPLLKVYEAGSPSPLTPKSVNSGVTFLYPSGATVDVFVYRQEEMIKVMLHELIHGMGLDSSQGTGLDVLEGPFKTMFGVHNSLRMNETYTDALACYLNVLVCAALSGEKMSALMQQEKEHICSQALHALRFYGHWVAGPRRTIWQPRREGVEEITHGVAYYILKGILYTNIPALRGFFKDHGCLLRDENAFVALLQRQLHVFWSKMASWQQRPPSRYLEMLKARSMRMSRADVTAK